MTVRPMSVLSKSMFECAKSATTSMTYINTAIADDDHERIVTSACAEFKEAAKEHEDNFLDEENLATFKKSVNNVINEVSRKYRAMHGKSIKCTNRKGGFVYKACEYIPRPVIGGFTDPASIPPVELPSLTANRIQAMVDRMPLTVMDEFFKQYDLAQVKDFIKAAMEAKED